MKVTQPRPGTWAEITQNRENLLFQPVNLDQAVEVLLSKNALNFSVAHSV